MKKIIAIFGLLSVLAIAGYSQGLVNWEHYYAMPQYQFDLGTSVVACVPGELIQVDKNSLAITNTPMPADIRYLNPHFSGTMGGIRQGPGYSVLVEGAGTTYSYDGTTIAPLATYQGFSTSSTYFVPYKGGSTFFSVSNFPSLKKWDGSVLTSYDSSNSTLPYPLNGVTVITPNDDIFFGEYNKVDVFHGGTWAEYDTSYFHHIISMTAYSTSPSSDFTFINSNDSVIHTFKSATGNWIDTIIPATMNHSVSYHTPKIFYDNTGNIWLGGDGIFCKYDGNIFYDYYSSLPAGASSATMTLENNLSATTFLISFTDANLLVTQYVVNTAVFSISPFTDIHATLPGNYFYATLKDNQGNLWFGSDETSGAMVKYNGTWSTPVYVHDYINCIRQDTAHTITFCTQGGAAQMVNGTSFNYFDTLNFFSNQLTEFAISQNHNYWFGAMSEIDQYIDNYMGPFNFFAPGVSYYPRFLNIDSTGNIWTGGTDAMFGGNGIGVFMMDTSGNFTSFNNSNSPLPDDSIIHIDRQGNSNAMWFSTRSGFARYWNGNWLVYTTGNSPIPSNRAESVLYTTDGTLWFCTMEGLASLKAGVWNVYTALNSPLYNSDVENIMVDNHCKLWIAADGGITSADIVGCNNNSIIVEGNVNKSNNSTVSCVEVDVYQLNSTATDVTTVGSVTTDNLGNFTFYTNDSGSYYFEANICAGNYQGQISSYPDSTLVIQNAVPFHIIANGNYSTQIHLRNAVNTIGSCTLNGKIVSTTETTSGIRVILMYNGSPAAEAISAADGSFQITNLLPYTYSVWVDKFGLNNATAPFVTVNCANSTEVPFVLYPDYLVLNTESLENDNAIKIYPSLSTGIITVEIAKTNEKMEITVYSLIGELVYKTTAVTSSTIIDLFDKSAGMYFIKLTGENIKRTKKVVLQR